jgi:uncharacterized membrane protein
VILSNTRYAIVKSHKSLAWSGWWNGVALAASIYLTLDHLKEGSAWWIFWLVITGLNALNQWFAVKRAEETANTNISTISSQAKVF